MMAHGRSPPGLSSSDAETATVSRERRRVALAAKVVVDHASELLTSRLTAIETKMGQLMSMMSADLESRIARLETLAVCSPSVDAVLDEMIQKGKFKHSQPDAEFSPRRLILSTDIERPPIDKTKPCVPSPDPLPDTLLLFVPAFPYRASNCSIEETVHEDTTSYVQMCSRTPEPELSPVKNDAETQIMEVSTDVMAETGEPVHFNISEIEHTDGADQTVFMQPRKRNRKSRCNGRAVQTDPVPILDNESRKHVEEKIEVGLDQKEDEVNMDDADTNKQNGLDANSSEDYSVSRAGLSDTTASTQTRQKCDAQQLDALHGEWASISCAAPGMVIKVVCSLLSGDSSPIYLALHRKGTVEKIDTQDDALVYFPAVVAAPMNHQVRVCQMDLCKFHFLVQEDT